MKQEYLEGVINNFLDVADRLYEEFEVQGMDELMNGAFGKNQQDTESCYAQSFEKCVNELTDELVNYKQDVSEAFMDILTDILYEAKTRVLLAVITTDTSRYKRVEKVIDRTYEELTSRYVSLAVNGDATQTEALTYLILIATEAGNFSDWLTVNSVKDVYMPIYPKTDMESVTRLENLYKLDRVVDNLESILSTLPVTVGQKITANLNVEASDLIESLSELYQTDIITDAQVFDEKFYKLMGDFSVKMVNNLGIHRCPEVLSKLDNASYLILMQERIDDYIKCLDTLQELVRREVGSFNSSIYTSYSSDYRTQLEKLRISLDVKDWLDNMKKLTVINQNLANRVIRLLDKTVTDIKPRISSELYMDLTNTIYRSYSSIRAEDTTLPQIDYIIPEISGKIGAEFIKYAKAGAYASDLTILEDAFLDRLVFYRISWAIASMITKSGDSLEITETYNDFNLNYLLRIVNKEDSDLIQEYSAYSNSQDVLAEIAISLVACDINYMDYLIKTINKISEEVF